MPGYDGPQQLRGADPQVLSGFHDALTDTHADELLTIALFAAGIVEANLRNPRGGDRDSVGVLQQRAGWGTVTARMDPYRAALAFLADATKRVLPKRPDLTPGQLAQAVQRSAYPDRYTQAEKAAEYVIEHTKPDPPPTGPDEEEPAVPTTAEKVIAAIKAQVGYREGRTNQQKFGDQVPGLGWVDDGSQPWCAVFAAWGFLKGGLKPGTDFPVTASCDVAMGWFKKKKRWSEYPAVGAQIFFGPHSADSTHTGIVTKWDATHVWTTEGNTNDSGSREGDGVYNKKYARKATRILGYGYPRYPEGIDSADPAWKRPAAPKPGATLTVIVKSGDTLGAIAAKHGLTLAALLKLNPSIKDADRITVGQKVRVK